MPNLPYIGCGFLAQIRDLANRLAGWKSRMRALIIFHLGKYWRTQANRIRKAESGAQLNARNLPSPESVPETKGRRVDSLGPLYSAMPLHPLCSLPKRRREPPPLCRRARVAVFPRHTYDLSLSICSRNYSRYGERHREQ